MSQSRLTIIPSRAISDPELTHTQLRVLCAIGSFTSKDQTAYPRQSTIAELLGITRQTVNQACKKLQEAGYLEIHNQFREDGAQSSNLYFVRLDPITSAELLDLTGGCRPSPTGGVSPRPTGGVKSRADRGCQPWADTINDSNKNDSIINDRRAGAREKIFGEMIQSGAPVPSVKALSRAVVDYDGCSMSVRSRWEYDRAMQDLEQYLKRAGIKLQVTK
jgi:predicted XRE-type DNA-binding protein